MTTSLPVGMAAVLALTAYIVTERMSPVPSQARTPPASQTAPTSDVITTQDGVRFRVETVASRLEAPWAFAFAPDGRLFFSERAGRVRILDMKTSRSQTALTLDDVAAYGEAGLLGLALDPDFAGNRFVYLYYTARVGRGGVNRIVRYREADGRLRDRTVLVDDIPATQIHDGGRLRFGPDGFLYATTGDADDERLPQNLSSNAGKVLRLTRDGAAAPGNPFKSLVYSYGHRNPQGIDWHPVTGALWSAEHGSRDFDEINAIRAGANYGWPTIRGGNKREGMEAPATFFSPSISPAGASFYRGQRIPRFANDLFVGALRGTHLVRLTIDDSGRIAAQERLLEGTFGRIRDVVSGPDGLLYFSTSNRDGRGTPVGPDDRILRLIPAS